MTADGVNSVWDVAIEGATDHHSASRERLGFCKGGTYVEGSEPPERR